jgi:hypothetical protein
MRRNELDRLISERQTQIALYASGSKVRTFLETELRALICVRMKRDTKKGNRNGRNHGTPASTENINVGHHADGHAA